MQSSDEKLHQYTREKDKASYRLARALTIEWIWLKSRQTKFYEVFFFFKRFGFKIGELNIENKKSNYKKLYHRFFHLAMLWWEIFIRHLQEDHINIQQQEHQLVEQIMLPRIKFVIHQQLLLIHNFHHLQRPVLDRFAFIKLGKKTSYSLLLCLVFLG